MKKITLSLLYLSFSLSLVACQDQDPNPPLLDTDSESSSDTGESSESDSEVESSTTDTEVLPMGVRVVTPESGSVEVSTSTVIQAEFDTDSDIDPETVTSESFTVTQYRFSNGQLDPMPVGGSFMISSKSITFTPHVPLEQDRDYTVSITQGIQNLTGGTINEDLSWSFTTASETGLLPETLYGISEQNSQRLLLRIRSTRPEEIEQSISITGIPSMSGSVTGMEYRDNELYLIYRSVAPVTGVEHSLYTLDVETGEATCVHPNDDGGCEPFAGTILGNFQGLAWNPGTDRFRLTSDGSANIRINPTANTIITDPSLVYPPTGGGGGAGTPGALVGSAYDGSALYGVNATKNTLVLQDPANGGIRTDIGGLGFDLRPNAGFDISTETGEIYLSSTNLADNRTYLYVVNLSNGIASQIGEIGTSKVLTSLTIAPEWIPAVPRR